MFRAPGAAVKRAKPATGRIVPAGLPYKGINYQSSYATMAPEYAVSLVNVTSGPAGIKTRTGYTEYANAIPGGSTYPVASLMPYYAAASVPTSPTATAPFEPRDTMMISSSTVTGAPNGKLFASKNGAVYNVTNGGTGPWTAETGVSGSGDYWSNVMLTNVAGSFLLIANEKGGYAYYNGTAWATPTFGGGAGQISGCDPANFCFVTVWKHRVWFIEKGTTHAWYLPVDSITGAATKLDLGSLLPHGGELSFITNWTIDSGNGIDDRLLFGASGGDVLLYQGTDPDDASTFSQIGTYFIGPLPAGHRQALSDGGEVYMLSQFGVSLASKLASSKSAEEASQEHLSWVVDPLISRYMSSQYAYLGWQLVNMPTEDLLMVGHPQERTLTGGDYFVCSLQNTAWSEFWDTNYASLVTMGNQMFAGTFDGRIVRAFNGTLDDVLLTSSLGDPIMCRVIPAFNNMAGGEPRGALQKIFNLVRPSFITSATPSVVASILTDYNLAQYTVVPSLPINLGSLWDVALWDTAIWGGAPYTIRKWVGCRGAGFAGTLQMDYACGGDTILTAIDYWINDGGPL